MGQQHDTERDPFAIPPRVDHPRPQLVRDDFVRLDGDWGFAVEAHGEGVRERWFERADPFSRTIVVPFPPEAPASGIGEDVDAPLWYRREFEYTPRDGVRLLLHFEGVDYTASVWVNGVHVGDHEGSQSRFDFDVTEGVHEGVNTIVVRAVDGRDLDQPRGKQDWQAEPHVIWYRRTSGIWRTVWLEHLPETRVDRLVLLPGEDLASVSFEVRLLGRTAPGARVELEFSFEGRVLARTAHDVLSAVVRGTVPLVLPGSSAEPETLWWTPDSPRLIDVAVRLADGDRVLDEVSSYVGLRTVSTDSAQVLLNGRPFFLRLVLEQGYWNETHLASPSFSALEREAALIKDLGFNGIRMHQTSADPRFLALCDRIGLVVFADAAAAYEYSDVALSRTVSEVTALVQRDLGHPSVIGWVPFNESWGVPRLPASAAQRAAVTALTALVKALDPSRLVIGNDGWEFVAGDLVGVHDYTQSGTILRERYGTAQDVRRTVAQGRPGGRALVLPGSEERAGAVPVLLSEFGGLSVHSADNAWGGYGDVLSPGQLLLRLAEMVEAIGPGSGLAGYCYTQLTDTVQEMNGLLTALREPKCPPDAIRSALLSASQV